MGLDPVRNWAVGSISAAFAAGATTFSLGSGEGSLFPDPSTEGAFNGVIWNATDFDDPLLDPLHEIVRIGARSGDDFSTVARAQESTTDVNHNVAGKVYKFALMPTAKLVQDIDARLTDGKQSYAADSGAADAYVITLSPAPAAYAAGQRFRFKAANTNTGASTLNVNGLGAKSVKTLDGNPLVAGDIVAGGMMSVEYDGTNFQLVTPSLTVNSATIQSGSYNYAGDTGSANAYAVALTPACTTYGSGGLKVRFQVGATNTAAATLDVDGLGTKDIVRFSNGAISPLQPGELQANTVAEVIYDGTRFILLSAGIRPGLNLVGEYSFSAASSLDITGLVAGARYRLTWEYKQNTSNGYPYVRFNNDSGSNYGWMHEGGTTQPNSGGDSESTGVANSNCRLQWDVVKANGYCTGSFEFQAMSADTTIAMGQAHSSFDNASFNAWSSGSVHYDGASAVTQVNLLPSAGTFTGTAKLFRMG